MILMLIYVLQDFSASGENFSEARLLHQVLGLKDITGAASWTSCI